MIVVIGQKSTNQIEQYMVESWRGFCVLFSSLLRWEHSDGLQVIFGDYSDIVENDIHTMQRFQESPGFCTLGVGRYASGKPAVALQNLGCFLKPQYWHKLSVNNVSADTTGITTLCIQTALSKGGNFGQCFWKA